MRALNSKQPEIQQFINNDYDSIKIRLYYNYNEYNFQRPYSETTAKIMDDEVLKMINEEYKRAKQILTEHKDGHNQLAQLLIEREVIFAEDVEKIFGKRPWISRSEEIMDEENKATIKKLEEQKTQKSLENKDTDNIEEKKDEVGEQQTEQTAEQQIDKKEDNSSKEDN